MIPEIISFSKSMPCRLQEFQSLLSDVETPCSEINKVWASIFDDLCIPKVGWLALWIVSEESCMDYNLIHPTVVIVKVLKYDCNDMAAVISVIAVQDDTILPAHLDVPLIELHPIKDQEYDINDLKIIANWLDKCRFFYKYLWYPWDAKLNVKLSQWCAFHLESRLKIQCDIQNGLIDKNVALYYKSLIKQSWNIEDSLNDSCIEELTESHRIDAINNCIRRKILKLELNIFEDPESRNDLMSLRLKKPALENKKIARFVWDGGNVDTLITHLNSAKSHIDDEFIIKVSSSFQEVLDSSNPNEIILLSPGSHRLKSLMGLQLGSTIKGLGERGETEILADCSGVKRAILFECFGDFNFENLTVSQAEGITIQISDKSLKISNCLIIGRKCPGTRGIVLLTGSKLILENCEIKSFGIGIVAQKGASLSISNCLIHDCLGGIKLSDESGLSIKNTEISDCSEYGIRLESSKNKSESALTGEIDLLQNYFSNESDLNVKSVFFRDNVKCNVIVDKSLDKFNSFTFDADILNDNNPNDDENFSD